MTTMSKTKELQLLTDARKDLLGAMKIIRIEKLLPDAKDALVDTLTREAIGLIEEVREARGLGW